MAEDDVLSAQPRTDGTTWTIRRLLSWTSDHLTRHGVEDARLASEVLLAHAIGRRRIDLYARPEEVPDLKQLQRFREMVRRAGRQEPVAYIVGQKEFFSLSFKVTADVLIPRPETETLVENVIDHCARARSTRPYLLDLGTGSGCMAIAVLVQVETARVAATDISGAALAVATQNAERHGVIDRFTPVQADRLALPDHVMDGAGFDVLMSNPPYVSREAVGALPVNVGAYEPREALTDEDDGLSFYRSIAADAPPLLAPKGVVFVEVGERQAGAVIEEMERGGAFACQRSWKDQVLGQERVLMFSRR